MTGPRARSRSAAVDHLNEHAALSVFVYAGTHTVGELRRHGTVGLGALDRNDGEFVMVDGLAHPTAREGTTIELADSATTPGSYTSPGLRLLFVVKRR